jgi:hypothetical protein
MSSTLWAEVKVAVIPANAGMTSHMHEHARILPHLEALVSFDTRNPPRDIGTGGIFDYLRAQSARVSRRSGRPRCRRVSPAGRARRTDACSTCIWTRCRVRRTGAPIRTRCA